MNTTVFDPAIENDELENNELDSSTHIDKPSTDIDEALVTNPLEFGEEEANIAEKAGVDVENFNKRMIGIRRARRASFHVIEARMDRNRKDLKQIQEYRKSIQEMNNSMKEAAKGSLIRGLTYRASWLATRPTATVNALAELTTKGLDRSNQKLKELTSPYKSDAKRIKDLDTFINADKAFVDQVSGTPIDLHTLFDGAPLLATYGSVTSTELDNQEALDDDSERTSLLEAAGTSISQITKQTASTAANMLLHPIKSVEAANASWLKGRIKRDLKRKAKIVNTYAFGNIDAFTDQYEDQKEFVSQHEITIDPITMTAQATDETGKTTMCTFSLEPSGLVINNVSPGSIVEALMHPDRYVSETKKPEANGNEDNDLESPDRNDKADSSEEHQVKAESSDAAAPAKEDIDDVEQSTESTFTEYLKTALSSKVNFETLAHDITEHLAQSIDNTELSSEFNNVITLHDIDQTYAFHVTKNNENRVLKATNIDNNETITLNLEDIAADLFGDSETLVKSFLTTLTSK